MALNPDLIILYDGDCGFCNRSVAYVLKREKKAQIHFAAIQSDFTKDLFDEKNWPQPDLNTFYFIERGKKYEKSSAALRVLRYLKFPTSWLQVFWIVPRWIRNKCYDFIAKRRQRLSKSFCVMPTPEQRARFVG